MQILLWLKIVHNNISFDKEKLFIRDTALEIYMLSRSKCATDRREAREHTVGLELLMPSLVGNGNGVNNTSFALQCMKVGLVWLGYDSTPA